ncbi:hypothetical protein [Kineosporia succinea]|uniref:Uncharacterized protein n=1 Tax=Kineosporia succinea TaxID=84632 RepID=A0ABT9PCI6_9ACTN|nr:hypothetical protein [Kineosporia succinea]MDP9830403.1 hypothetical protein [Kineosporia succinea]
MKMKSLAAGMLTAGAVASLGVIGSADAAQAAACGTSHSVTNAGAKSQYSISCSGGKVYVSGSVTDTDADGKCAQVKAQIIGTWFYSAKACPEGQTKYFSWSHIGSSAAVYTYTV